MSVMWTYEPNEEREEIYCPHCSDWRDTPYFNHGKDSDQKYVVCLRCARVLSKAYKMAIEREGW